MLSNFNIAGLTSEELEHLISERCSAFGTVKRVAICDSFPIVNYKLAFVAMSTPAELATVIKEVGATSIGDAAVVKLDMKPQATRTGSGSADVVAVCLAAVALLAAGFGLFISAEQRKADVAFVQVFSKLELGLSRKQVDAAAASTFGLSYQPPAAKPNLAAFAGSCCSLLVAGTRYDLLAEFSADDHLLSARLLKAPAGNGGDKGCVIFFEIPSVADKTYPYSCPAGVQNP